MSVDQSIDALLQSIPKGAAAIIFDMDGTLIDSKPAHVLSWRKVVQEDCGRTFTDEDHEALNGRSSFEFVSSLQKTHGFHLAPDEAKAKKDAYYTQLLGTIRAYPQTLRVVEHVHKKLPIALGTNEDRDVALAILRALSLERLFDAVVTACDVARPKPAPDVFLECARRMGVEPARCHVFEDSVVGIAAAKEAGMSVIDVSPFLHPGSA